MIDAESGEAALVPGLTAADVRAPHNCNGSNPKKAFSTEAADRVQAWGLYLILLWGKDLLAMAGMRWYSAIFFDSSK